MEDYARAVEIVADDFADLEREIRRELSGEGWTEIRPLMEEHRHLDSLLSIQKRIEQLLDALRARLERLRGVVVEFDGSEARKDAVVAEIFAAEGLISQLMAVWGRLDSLVSLIEQRQMAASAALGVAGAGSLFARLKDWRAIVAGWIKRISGQLWNLLRQMFTPKEWKLGFKVTSGPFNLADANVEITFGP